MLGCEVAPLTDGSPATTGSHPPPPDENRAGGNHTPWGKGWGPAQEKHFGEKVRGRHPSPFKPGVTGGWMSPP